MWPIKKKNIDPKEILEESMNIQNFDNPKEIIKIKENTGQRIYSKSTVPPCRNLSAWRRREERRIPCDALL